MQLKESTAITTSASHLEKVFLIPRRWDFRYSPLARQIRRTTGDPLRSEGLHILATIAGLVLLAFIQFFCWALLSDQILSDPFGPTAIIFWIVQVSMTLSFLGMTMVGFAPKTLMSVTSSELEIRSGSQQQIFPLNAIRSAEVIDSEIYQKHYRRYKSATLYGTVSNEKLLLFWHDDEPIILGLPVDELQLAVNFLSRISVPPTDIESSQQPAYS